MALQLSHTKHNGIQMTKGRSSWCSVSINGTLVVATHALQRTFRFSDAE